MNKTEILHYLRTSSKVDDPRLDALIDECMEQVNQNVTPRTIYRIFDCDVTDNKMTVEGFEFKSKRLADTISGCKKVCIFGPAVTRYRVLERSGQTTRIAFFPQTGRTHQLRVHAAHPDGLGCQQLLAYTSPPNKNK